MSHVCLDEGLTFNFLNVMWISTDATHIVNLDCWNKNAMLLDGWQAHTTTKNRVAAALLPVNVMATEMSTAKPSPPLLAEL